METVATTRRRFEGRFKWEQRTSNDCFQAQLEKIKLSVTTNILESLWCDSSRSLCQKGGLWICFYTQ